MFPAGLEYRKKKCCQGIQKGGFRTEHRSSRDLVIPLTSIASCIVGPRQFFQHKRFATPRVAAMKIAIQKSRKIETGKKSLFRVADKD